MKRKAIFLFAFIFVILIGVVGYVNRAKVPAFEDEITFEGDAGRFVFDESNISALTDIPGETKVEEGLLEINMNTTWHFRDGSQPSANAYVGNLSTNNHPMVFDVTLADTGEEVYESTIIPIGFQLSEIILEKRLPRGEYDAVCTYYLLDDEGNELSKIAVDVILDIME